MCLPLPQRRNEERALEASSRGHHVHMSKKEVRMCVGVMPFVAHETWSLPPQRQALNRRLRKEREAKRREAREAALAAGALGAPG